MLVHDKGDLSPSCTQAFSTSGSIAIELTCATPLINKRSLHWPYLEQTRGHACVDFWERIARSVNHMFSLYCRNDPNFSSRQIGLGKQCRPRSDCSQRRFWPLCLNFRWFTAKFSGVRKFRNFTVCLLVSIDLLTSYVPQTIHKFIFTTVGTLFVSKGF